MSENNSNKCQKRDELKAKAFGLELHHLKRRYLISLINCLTRGLNGTFQDLLNVLRKLYEIQDIYLQKREQILDKYQLSQDFDPNYYSIDKMLRPFLPKIMGPRYSPLKSVTDYIYEMIAENTDKIVYEQIAKLKDLGSSNLSRKPSRSRHKSQNSYEVKEKSLIDQDDFLTLLLRAKKILQNYDVNANKYGMNSLSIKKKASRSAPVFVKPKLGKQIIAIDETPLRTNLVPVRRSLLNEIEQRKKFMTSRSRAGQTDPENFQKKGNTDYGALISPDEAEFNPAIRRDITYQDLPESHIDDTQMPDNLMSNEFGQVFLPDMIDFNDGRNLLDEFEVPDSDLLDESMPDLDMSTEEKSNVEKLLQKARQIEQEVNHKSSVESFIPLIPESEAKHQQHLKPIGPQNVNLLDTTDPEMDSVLPLEAVKAPFPKTPHLMDTENYGGYLPAPLRPVYVPLKPTVQSSSTSTLGTSSSELLFQLNLPKDFTKSGPSTVQQKRDQFAQLKDRVVEENLFDESIPDEDFYYDSDPEIRRKYYKLVDISSPETSFIQNLPKDFISGIPEPYKGRDRFAELKANIPSEDLFDTDMPEFTEDSSSSEEIPIKEYLQSPVKDQPIFMKMPFPPSQLYRQLRSIKYGKPHKSRKPPHFLYTLREEVQSPGGSYAVVSPGKMRRVRIHEISSSSDEYIENKLKSPEKQDKSPKKYEAKPSKIPAELQKIIDKYEDDDFRIHSPPPASDSNSEEKERKIIRLQKCLKDCEKRCVEDYKNAGKGANSEKQLAEDIALEMSVVSKSTKQLIIEEKRNQLEKNLHEMSKIQDEIQEMKKEKKKLETSLAQKEKITSLLSKKIAQGQKLSERDKNITRRPKPQVTLPRATRPVRQPPKSTQSKPKPSTSDRSVRIRPPTMKPPVKMGRPPTTKPPVRMGRPPTQPLSRPTVRGVSATRHNRPGEKAGFVDIENDSILSPHTVKEELQKLFMEFSDKLKSKGLLPTDIESPPIIEHYKRKSVKSFETLIEQSELKSESNLSEEFVINKIDLE